MKQNHRQLLGLIPAFFISQGLYATDIEEIVVAAEFRESKLLELANSVTVIDQSTIRARGATHLEQLLNLAPNVNFSSGASRGRFFQIRGIGERSQFVDPVNPSVGLIIDGMDFTGLGLAASTLDINQVEVLRGPQGTLFGANALAGLININSNAPSKTFTGNLSAEVAEFDHQLISFVASGPLSDRLGYRLAVSQQKGDGFTDNVFLNRDDTSNIDEFAARGKLRFQASDDLLIDLTGFYLNADNGYDDFSLENNRTTGSDQPGEDTQKSLAGSIKISWQGNDNFNLKALVSAIDAETDYNFDEDWSFVGAFDEALFPYSSADSFDRDRQNVSLDVRLLSKPGRQILNNSTHWAVGFYTRIEEEQLTRIRFADLAFDSQFNNSFDTQNYAVYGQLETSLAEQWTLTTGLRVEQRNADYADSTGVTRAPEETLWGGRVVLEYQATANTLVYGLVSRGYKAGGVNGQIISAAESNADISPSTFFFDTETLLNYEIGLKSSWLDNRLQTQIALFYQDRSDAQVSQSIFNPNDFSFDDFLTNTEGNAIGLELEFSYQATAALDIYGSVGWLDSEFDDFVSAAHVDARDDFNGIALAPVNLDGRDVAHAPNYQFTLGGELRLTENWYVSIEIEGKDEFFFSNSHDERSTSYELINARVGYNADSWQLSLWARNLTDEDVEVRGFFFSNQFGNNPADGFAPETYTQLGEPRIVGVTANYSF